MSKVDTASHPFIVATVLDPATKGCTQFPRHTPYGSVRARAQAHRCHFISWWCGIRNWRRSASYQAGQAAWQADSRSASLRFLATTSIQLVLCLCTNSTTTLQRPMPRTASRCNGGRRMLTAIRWQHMLHGNTCLFRPRQLSQSGSFLLLGD